jgi:hypothetical protein
MNNIKMEGLMSQIQEVGPMCNLLTRITKGEVLYPTVQNLTEVYHTQKP